MEEDVDVRGSFSDPGLVLSKVHSRLQRTSGDSARHVGFGPQADVWVRSSQAKPTSQRQSKFDLLPWLGHHFG
jgi:hypothetical protein